MLSTVTTLMESFLGFKSKKSLILEKRNSILKLLIILNIPNLLILFIINKQLPLPYMDEQFHYGQFLSFYNNQSMWNNKITTPPGLYHIQKLLSYIVGKQLVVMRAINCLVFGNLFAVFMLKILEFQDHNKNNISKTLHLVITPTIYFFNFLDYTDAASLAFVTMAMYYNLVGSSWRMGFMSLAAIYIRQNNIVWAAYFLLYRIVTEYAQNISILRGNIFRLCLSFAKLVLTNHVQIIKKNAIQIAIFPLFFAYLYRYNDGHLLFGDRQNHVPCFHPTQFLYLTVFCALFVPITMGDYAHTLKESFNRIKYSRHALATYLFLLSLCLVLVDQFSLVHQFTLADNRHYVFYLYRYFRWARYPLCLVYPLTIIFVARVSIHNQQSMVKFILWVSASVFYLAPCELVEFRYFTIPFILLGCELRNRNLAIDVQRIHSKELMEMRIGWQNKMIWGTLIKIGINIGIFGNFLFRPFGEHGNSRFMW